VVGCDGDFVKQENKTQFGLYLPLNSVNPDTEIRIKSHCSKVQIQKTHSSQQSVPDACKGHVLEQQQDQP
jgi:hypothetical protein